MKINYKELTPKIRGSIDDINGVKTYKKMIKRGEHRPILLDSNTYDIIDGNHTLMAYQELGIEPPLIYECEYKVFEKAMYNMLSFDSRIRDNPILDLIYIMIEEDLVKKVGGNNEKVN